jgi:hypothetical protein
MLANIPVPQPISRTLSSFVRGVKESLWSKVMRHKWYWYSVHLRLAPNPSTNRRNGEKGLNIPTLSRQLFLFDSGQPMMDGPADLIGQFKPSLTSSMGSTYLPSL